MKATELLHPDDGAGHIMSLFMQADRNCMKDGMGWYQREHEWAKNLSYRCPRFVKHPIETVCAVTAILSPSARWERNKRDAEMMLTWANTQSIRPRHTGGNWTPNFAVTTYRKNQQKAASLLRMAWMREHFTHNEGSAYGVKLTSNPVYAHHVSGPKVEAFAQLLAYPDNPNNVVCVDRHAVRAYQRHWTSDNSHGSISLTPAVYRTVAQGYVNAGLALGVPPHQVQAVCWVVLRDLYNRRTK